MQKRCPYSGAQVDGACSWVKSAPRNFRSGYRKDAPESKWMVRFERHHTDQNRHDGCGRS